MGPQLERQITTSPEDRQEAPPGLGEDSPESPFLPGTRVQWAWDSTSLGYIKTCPRLYQYIMIEGWGSNEESIHLRFGQEIHTSMQEYDLNRARGIDHETALADVVQGLHERVWNWDVDTDGRVGKYKNKTSLMMTVVNYLDQYNADQPDPAKTYIMDNGAPAVELSFRFELDFSPRDSDQPYMICGHLDRVVDFNGDLFVMDYKSTTQTPGSYYFDQWEPNNQMSLYSQASQVILNSPVKGVIIDAIQILLEPPHTRSVRGFTYRTPGQLDEWIHDLSWHLAAAESYAENNYWPQNDTACDKYGGCRFRRVCSKDPRMREQFLKSNFTKGEPWNPLRVR